MVLRAAIVAAAVLLTSCGEKTASELVAAANESLEEGKLNKASVELRNALQVDPSSNEARYLLARVLYLGHDLVGAEVELTKARDAGFDSNRVIPLMAKVLLARGQFKRVLDEYKQLRLADAGADAELHVSVAAAQATMGQLAEARSRVDEILAKRPSHAEALLLRARLVASGGALPEALDQVRAVTAAEPSNVDAWMLLGNLHLAGNDMPAAAAAFEKVLALDADHALAFSSLALTQLRRRDQAAATATWERMSKVLPSHPRTKLVEAQLAELRRDLPRARELAQQLLQRAPEDPTLLHFAAGVHLQLGAISEAEGMLTKALFRVPEHTGLRQLLAQVHLRSGQPDKALSVLQPGLDHKPTPVSMLNLAGQVHLQLGDPAKAARLFERALAEQPGDTAARTALAMMKLSQGQAELGAAELQSIAAASDETSADTALVHVLLQRNDIAGALKAIDALEKKDPKSVAAAELRGRAHLGRGDVAAARKSYDAALERRPDHFPALAALVEIDAANGEFEAAQKRLEAWLKARPSHAPALLALAKVRQRAGADRAEVQQRLAAAVAAAPGDTAARLMLVEMLIGQRSYKAAITLAQEGLASNALQPALLDALGRAQSLAGDHHQAVMSIGNLVQLQPGSSTPHLRLAEVYAHAGNDAGAISALRRAVAITPRSDDARRALVAHLVKTRQVAEALAVARQAQKDQPEHWIGPLLEAEIRIAGREKDATLAVLRSALTRIPATPLATRYHDVLIGWKMAADAERFVAEWLARHPGDRDFLKHVADAALVRRDLPAAERHFAELVKLVPGHPAMLNNLAWVRLQQNKPALSLAQQAARIAPAEASVLDTLAHAQAREKQAAQALATGRRALALEPGNVSLRLSIAEAFAMAGDAAAARQELERVSQSALASAKQKDLATRRLAALPARPT